MPTSSLSPLFFCWLNSYFVFCKSIFSIWMINTTYQYQSPKTTHGKTLYSKWKSSLDVCRAFFLPLQHQNYHLSTAWGIAIPLKSMCTYNVEVFLLWRCVVHDISGRALFLFIIVIMFFMIWFHRHRGSPLHCVLKMFPVVPWGLLSFIATQQVAYPRSFLIHI